MNWYDDFIDKAKLFIASGDELAPTLFLQKDNKLSIIGLNSLFEIDKDIISLIIKEIIAYREPTEYLLMMESWVKMFDAKDNADQSLSNLVVDGTLKVSELATRKECITLLHGTQTEERIGTIIFKREGKRILFQPIEWMDTGEMKGRFTNLRQR